MFLDLNDLKEYSGPFMAECSNDIFQSSKYGKKYFVKKIIPRHLETIDEVINRVNRGELIAETLCEKGIPSIVAIKDKNGSFARLHQKNVYLVYPWYNGTIYKKDDIDADVCKRIGEILGQIHSSNVNIESFSPLRYMPKIDVLAFNRLINFPNYNNYSQFEVLRKTLIENISLFIDILPMCEKSTRFLYCEQPLVTSHTNIHHENLMHLANEIKIIDWEFANKTNPELELFDLCLNWCGFSDKINWNHYNSVISGYCNTKKDFRFIHCNDVINKTLYCILSQFSYRINLFLANPQEKDIMKFVEYASQIRDLVYNRECYVENMQLFS